MNKKTVTILSLILLLGVVAGSSLAWLLDKTDPVKNTFTTSDVDITLSENGATQGTNQLEKSFKMIPGHVITKDPKVTVTANSEACYVFVKLVKSTEPKFDDFMTYAMADGWTELTGEGNDGVYYRTVDADTAKTGTEFGVIKDNAVTVKDTVTKEMMAQVKDNNPTLTVTAYACQYYKNNTPVTGGDQAGTPFEVAEAWKLAQENTATPNN